MANPRVRVPKISEQVAIPANTGPFVVSALHNEQETADLTLIKDAGHVKKDVPWAVLIYLDDLEGAP